METAMEIILVVLAAVAGFLWALALLALAILAPRNGARTAAYIRSKIDALEAERERMREMT